MDHTPNLEILPEELFSLSSLSRKLDIPYSRALQLMEGKTLAPDFTDNRNFFFRPSRLPEIKAAVEAAKSR